MPTTPTLNGLSLFPLNTVLFPEGILRLRLFEVRYLDMVRRCRIAGAPFGVVALTSGGEVQRAGEPHESFQHVGTIAHIIEHDDSQVGLVMIQCQGQMRFRIAHSQRRPQGLWVADVQLLDADQSISVPEDLRHASTALQKMLQNLRARDAGRGTLNAVHAIAPTPAQLNDCGWVANRWCELLPLPLATKQHLLQLDSPLLRLELVSDALAGAGIVF